MCFYILNSFRDIRGQNMPKTFGTPCIKSFADQKPNKVMNELLNIQFKKPGDKPKFSSELFQLALMLRYTSLYANRLLLDHFPLPSVSLLKKTTLGRSRAFKSYQNNVERGKN